MKKLILLVAVALLLASCKTNLNPIDENIDSSLLQEEETQEQEYQVDEIAIIVDFLKSQQAERYCLVDIDGDNRDEIVSIAEENYFVYAKDADVISSPEQITELAATFGTMPIVQYGNNHIIVTIGHIGWDTGDVWCEYFSTELKNSKIVSETTFTGLMEDDDINNCEHGTSSKDMKPCSKEEALSHYPTSGMTSLGDLEYIEL